MMKSNNELIRLYKDAPFRYKLYTLIRVAICPLYEIEKYVPGKGKILDFGCGHGIFANILAMGASDRNVIGIDIMEDKIKVAKASSSGRNNIGFKTGDIREVLARDERVECITLLDTLCYLSLDEKKDLLKRLYRYLESGGLLVIKCIQERPLLKYWWTLFHMATIDKFIHRNFSQNSYFMKRDSYMTLLKDMGFKVEYVDMSKGYPYPHCLYICSKR